MDFLRDVVNRMSNEREDIINTPDYPSRGIKTVYFWMMSTIEAYFWERRYPDMRVDVWAKDQNVFLYIFGSGSQAETYYYCGSSLSDGDIDIMFAGFVGMINQSSFRAEGPDIWQSSGQFMDHNGMYHMRIFIDGIK